MPFMLMEHEVPPEDALLEDVGDISGIDVFNNNVLVGTYLRPEKTKSGIILTDQHRDEDKYQSKVGLILKVGPQAFKDKDSIWFQGANLTLYQWVLFRPSDGISMVVNKVPCRLLTDTNVRARLPHPDIVW